MYVPPIYRASSPDQMRSLMSRYPLGLLVTNGASVPHATHLAVIPAADVSGDLVGATLFGHMNRVNPHWAALTDGMPAKLVFTGPGSYISPAIYDSDPAAPTWNFVSVHLQGTLRLVVGIAETLDVVRRTAAVLEGAFGDGWDQSGSIDYFRSIVRGVGAFEFQIESADGMFKLSQDKEPELQQRIIDRLGSDGHQSSKGQISDLMCRYNLGVGSNDR